MKNHPEVRKDTHIPPTEMITEEQKERMDNTNKWLKDNLLNEMNISKLSIHETDQID
jgi:uncharacterized alpha/beta hydrolase family protein